METKAEAQPAEMGGHGWHGLTRIYVGRARHSVRAGVCIRTNGAHGVTRPTSHGSQRRRRTGRADLSRRSWTWAEVKCRRKRSTGGKRREGEKSNTPGNPGFLFFVLVSSNFPFEMLIQLTLLGNGGILKIFVVPMLLCIFYFSLQFFSPGDPATNVRRNCLFLHEG